jgi:hypothetical protein
VQRDGAEWAIALDVETGKEQWAKKIAPAFKNSYGNGPRCTPAIDGGLVYVQSVTGPLVCLKADDGSIVWQRNLLTDFGTKNITWGLAASPLVEGNLVLAIPGAKGAGVAAFDKKTGTIVWKLGDDKAAYASPMAVTVGGQRQLIFFTAAGLLAATPEGKELWRVPWTTEFDCNICTPLVLGEQLFVSSGEQVGCALFRLSPGGAPEIAWQSKGKTGVMTNYWANSVAHDGYLYGLSGEFDKAHRPQLRRRQDRHARMVAKGFRQRRHHARRRAPVHDDEEGRPGARASQPAEVRGEGPRQPARREPHRADDRGETPLCARSREHLLFRYRGKVSQ